MYNDKDEEELRKIATCGLHIEYAATCRPCRDRFIAAGEGYNLGLKDAKRFAEIRRQLNRQERNDSP